MKTDMQNPTEIFFCNIKRRQNAKARNVHRGDSVGAEGGLKNSYRKIAAIALMKIHRRIFYTQKYARNGVKLREQAEATGDNKRSKKGAL